jgi:putative ABC transport system substrate-binding protein
MMPLRGVQSGSGNFPNGFRPNSTPGWGLVLQNQNEGYRIPRGRARYDRCRHLRLSWLSEGLIVAVAQPVSPRGLRSKTDPDRVFMGPSGPNRPRHQPEPGAAITGVTTGSEILSKQLEMLHELVPKARAIAMLVNPKNPTHLGGKARWQPFADAIGVPIESVSASTESEFESAIASLAEKQIEALNVVPDTLFGSYRESLIAVLARHAMPAMFPIREAAVDGALISYGCNYASALRQLGVYVGRILKGEKPADLPVLLPTKFDLVINLKTAKTLGLTVPSTLLAQATEVIE